MHDGGVLDFAHDQVHQRVIPYIRAELVRQIRGNDRARRSDGHLSPYALAEGRQLGAQLVHVGEYLPYMAYQDFACGAEYHAFRRALQQTQAHDIFQFLDAFCRSRRRNVLTQCRTPDLAFFHCG